MGALKLCTYKKAEYPLYLEMLSLHVYTMEELCYAMESSLFLLDESWMGTEFFQWIAEGVGNAELAGQLRRLYQRHRDVYECAAFLFSASGFYSRQEQKELEQIIEKMKGKNSMERRKMKADYYLAKKRYRYAAYITEDDSADTRVPELQFKTMKEAYAHFSDVSDQEEYYTERKKVAAASHAFNWKGREAEIRHRWISEYEQMYS